MDLPAGTSPNATTVKVYWTMFYAQPNPQVEIAKRPLKTSSKVTDIDGNENNQLVCANAVRFIESKLWVMNLSPCHASDASIVRVYGLPFTSTSKPQKTFTLSGPLDADHMTFDASGNLWVPSVGNNSVYEYKGPFTSSGTLTPATTLTMGLNVPQGLGFDSKGNLYVANTGTTNGKHAITVFKAPISNRTPYYLNGVTSPSGLAFDRNGNLFASSNGTTGAIAEYASNHLKSASMPSVVDSTGLAPSPYGADLNFDANGNLYDADCGSAPGIYSYPTATKSFSSTLAPTFYTNDTLKSIGCVWGVAIH
ncbi:MAG: hypothetical protein WB615_02535 [Candidatus Tumulicola sp.]